MLILLLQSRVCEIIYPLLFLILKTFNMPLGSFALLRGKKTFSPILLRGSTIRIFCGNNLTIPHTPSFLTIMSKTINIFNISEIFTIYSTHYY